MLRIQGLPLHTKIHHGQWERGVDMVRYVNNHHGYGKKKKMRMKGKKKDLKKQVNDTVLTNYGLKRIRFHKATR